MQRLYWCAFLVVNDAVMGTYLFQIYQPPSVTSAGSHWRFAGLSHVSSSLRPPSSGAGGALGNLNKDWMVVVKDGILTSHKRNQHDQGKKLLDIPSVNARGFCMAQDHPALHWQLSFGVGVFTQKSFSFWLLMMVGRVSRMDPTNQLMSIHIYSILFRSFTACTFPAFRHVCSCKMQPMQWEMLPAWPKVCCILKRDWHSLTILDCLSLALLRASGGASNSECDHGCIMILGTQVAVNGTWKEHCQNFDTIVIYI